VIATQVLRRRLMVGLASLLVTAHLSGALALGANSPQGDNAAPWPTSWTAYTTSDGSPIVDAENDQSPAMVDIASNGGTAPSVYAATDGTNLFFRMRLKGDPRDAGKGGFDNANWLVLVATAADDTVRGVVGLYGKGNSTDYVYVSNTPGSAVTQVYATPFDSQGANDSHGARGLEDGYGQYFVDFQVPLARLAAASGNTITASTPVKLFFGSSIANNLATINKDMMTGSAISFDGLATWTLAGGPSTDPTPEPSVDPSDEPSPDPSPDPSDESSPEPSDDPSPDPSDEPSPEPSDDPTPDPSPDPSDEPSPEPTYETTEEGGILTLVNQSPSVPGMPAGELDYGLVAASLVGSMLAAGVWFLFGRRRRQDDEVHEMTAPAYN
jgi:hypothetical protein